MPAARCTVGGRCASRAGSTACSRRDRSSCTRPVLRAAHRRGRDGRAETRSRRCRPGSVRTRSPRGSGRATVASSGNGDDRRRLEIVRPLAARPAEVVPRSVHDGRADGRRWDDQRDVDRLERQRFDDLADAADHGTASDERRTARRSPGRQRRPGRRNPPSAGSRRSVGRTSTEPAAMRQLLVNVNVRLVAEPAARPSTRGSPRSSGRPRGKRTVGAQPRRLRVDRQRVVPVERHHLGVEQMDSRRRERR